MAWDLIKSEKLNQSYRGHAERCVYTFTVGLPDQMGASWTAQQNLQAHIDELQGQGEVLLEYKLWEDKSPLLETHYLVEIVASASPLPWAIIIVGVLIIIGIFLIGWSISSVSEIAEYAPGAVVGATWAIVALAVVAGLVVVSGMLPQRKKEGANGE